MNATAFKKSVFENFSTDLPDSSRLFEGVRTEGGHEKLEFLTSVEWPEFSVDMMSTVAGEFWQLSSVWAKYYLPTFIILTTDLELEVQFYGKAPKQYAEITNENQEALIDCLFGYWCAMDNLVRGNFNIQTNRFYGLSSKQVSLVEIWLQGMDFETLNKIDIFPDGFDSSDKGLDNFISVIKKHSF